MFQKLRVEERNVTHSRKISHPRAGHLHRCVEKSLVVLVAAAAVCFVMGESTSPCIEGQREGYRCFLRKEKVVVGGRGRIQGRLD